MERRADRPSWGSRRPVPAAGRARSSRRHAAGRRWRRRSGPSADFDGGGGRVARHGLGRGRRADDRRRTRPTSPPAPGRWSGSSSTSRCSARRAGPANFTNEGGVDGRVRYLRNVSGLWLLQRVAADLASAAGERVDLSALLGRGRRGSHRRWPDVRRRRIRASCRPATCRRGSRAPARRPEQPAPSTPAESSAASSNRWPPRTPDASTRPRSSAVGTVEVVHMVGGGCQNDAALPAHRRPSGLPGAGRAGGGHRARQRAGPGADGRSAARGRSSELRPLLREGLTCAVRAGDSAAPRRRRLTE